LQFKVIPIGQFNNDKRHLEALAKRSEVREPEPITNGIKVGCDGPKVMTVQISREFHLWAFLKLAIGWKNMLDPSRWPAMGFTRN
jgi:hypothetical protein